MKTLADLLTDRDIVTRGDWVRVIEKRDAEHAAQLATARKALLTVRHNCSVAKDWSPNSAHLVLGDIDKAAAIGLGELAEAATPVEGVKP